MGDTLLGMNLSAWMRSACTPRARVVLPLWWMRPAFAMRRQGRLAETLPD